MPKCLDYSDRKSTMRKTKILFLGSVLAAITVFCAVLSYASMTSIALDRMHSLYHASKFNYTGAPLSANSVTDHIQYRMNCYGYAFLLPWCRGCESSAVALLYFYRLRRRTDQEKQFHCRNINSFCSDSGSNSYFRRRAYQGSGYPLISRDPSQSTGGRFFPGVSGLPGR